MAAPNIMSIVGKSHPDSMLSTLHVDEAISPTEQREQQSTDENPPVSIHPTVQLTSENGPEISTSSVIGSNEGQLLNSEKNSEIEQEMTFYQTLARQVISEETAFDASDKACTSAFRNLVPELVRKEKETPDRVEARSRQAILHIAYTDLRVKNLEKEVKSLRRDIQGLPADFDIETQPGPDQRVYLHELKRSSPLQFPLNEKSADIPPHLRPGLEVLLADTIDSTDTKTGAGGSGQRSPEAIRIRPALLAAHLGKISGENLAVTVRRNSEDTQVCAMLIRNPFKVFCTFEDQIRASVRELEIKIDKKVNKATESKGKTQEGTEVGHERDVYDDKHLLVDLKLLIEFLDVDLKPILELRSEIEGGTATTIRYEDLWHLFKLGDDVIQQQSSVPKVYRVINLTGGREIWVPKIDRDHKPVPVDGFVIDCYSLGFDGSFFGPKLTKFHIRKFQGARLITSLSVFPLRFDPSKPTLEESLVDRGSKYLEMTKLPYAHRLLVGTTLDEPAEEIDGQIIVDMTLAINRNTHWQPHLDFDEADLSEGDKRETQAEPFCTHLKYDEGCCGSDIVHKDLRMDRSIVEEYIQTNLYALKRFPASELDQKDKILLPHWTYGFVLRSRQWVTVNICDLSDVVYENNFDSLVLPPRHKDTVKALVRNHARDLTIATATSNLGASMDMVRGKGVGKTSTAECVADLTHRPLFPVTCGDIGETAAEVQASLDRNFQLAHKWGCVLLLDEADVFMAKRNRTDLRRNAVVSVFLRTLEYYSGILFLTTNRVGSIDPAFKSRIHMSLYFPHLGLEATLKLYQILLDRTIAEQKISKKVDFKVKSKEIQKFARSHFKRLEKAGLATWNGRQIRNAFQTAITLAEYSSRQPGAESTTLGKDQFQIVADASKDFDSYMKKTLGNSEAEVAWQEEIRYDGFGNLNRDPPAARSERRNEKPPHLPARNAKDPESESSSDDDDDEDGEDDGEENCLSRVRDEPSTADKDKAVAAATTKDAIGSRPKQLEMDEFEEFLLFKEMKKKKSS
ncbi:uncharacterized protein RAG0_04060 [Rhynchosporium agropyri]|uniref:Uncharacterized protein n=1 Tax=Rhynchosporium agropyri TaxID=914238 RepID=A0A1E1K7R6_9HELO|nr:uncharacterized protein RAG0_04060 [Rhynchosporium agropyri]